MSLVKCLSFFYAKMADLNMVHRLKPVLVRSPIDKEFISVGLIQTIQTTGMYLFGMLS